MLNIKIQVMIYFIALLNSCTLNVQNKDTRKTKTNSSTDTNQNDVDDVEDGWDQFYNSNNNNTNTTNGTGDIGEDLPSYAFNTDFEFGHYLTYHLETLGVNYQHICPENSVLNGMFSSFDSDYEDRKVRFYCDFIHDNQGFPVEKKANCTWKGVNQDLGESMSCSTDKPFIAGVKSSWVANKRKINELYCCAMQNYKGEELELDSEACKEKIGPPSPNANFEVNGFRGPLNFACTTAVNLYPDYSERWAIEVEFSENPVSSYLRSISVRHNNTFKDGTYSFQCCSVKKK